VREVKEKKDEVSFRVKKEDSKELVPRETEIIEEEVYEAKEVSGDNI
jgi:hypothetical protein